MQKTSIEWADFSSNPIKLRLHETGKEVNACVKCSPGCENCYAEAMTRRWWPKSEGKFPGYSLPLLKMGVIVTSDKELHALLKIKPRGPFKNGVKPMIFVGDMNDSGGDWVPFDLLDQMFAVAALRPDMIFQFLTKRPEMLAEYLNQPFSSSAPNMSFLPEMLGRSSYVPDAFQCDAHRRVSERVHYAMEWLPLNLLLGKPGCSPPWPLPNVWLGTSVENQEWADKRIPHLLRCPAAVRFLSCEPLIGAVDLLETPPAREAVELNGQQDPHGSFDFDPWHDSDLSGIHWVIVGGESGAGARPCNIDWIRSIVKQCKAAGVACFVKQLGKTIMIRNDSCSEWPEDGDGLITNADYEPSYQGEMMEAGLEHPKGGDPSEWPEDLRVREFPKVTA